MTRSNLGPALLSVVPDIRPEPAPFAGMCKSLARRRTQVDPAWYLGAVKHLVGKFYLWDEARRQDEATMRALLLAGMRKEAS